METDELKSTFNYLDFAIMWNIDITLDLDNNSVLAINFSFMF